MAKAKTEFVPITRTSESKDATTPPRLKVVKRGVEKIYEPSTREEYEQLKRRAKATAEAMSHAGIDYEVLEERDVPEPESGLKTASDNL